MVHNIVLYPEKHSWCQTTPIQQIVASPGYEPVTIDNNVCVGACYSYSIPKTQPAEPGELIGPYCDSCQPSEIKCYHVNLRADDKNVDGPKVIQKRVQIIMNCSCQSCDKIRKEDCEITDENTLELPQNLFTEERNYNRSNFEDLPDLLDAPGQNSTQNILHNTENDIKLKNKLKKWFEIYQNETEDTKTDEDFYFKDQKHKTHLEEYNNVDLDHDEENNAKIENDLQNLPDTFGIEVVPSHHKGNHIDIGIQHDHNNIIVDDISRKHHETKSGVLGGHHGHHSNHHQHHIEGHGHHMHHLGEEQQIGKALLLYELL
ncbi:hypothetical protein NQ314_010056 [Rhamnusium bicolor]|uniref:DAN domain-containing protein n=1 Tax=Rhamnusium bicolor TaxID=1586634 RepID=A0AAV8XUF3_9CUCU|nr:hypothetical protein NQ314_010056 [Rhamnusium bicolor]